MSGLLFIISMITTGMILASFGFYYLRKFYDKL